MFFSVAFLDLIISPVFILTVLTKHATIHDMSQKDTDNDDNVHNRINRSFEYDDHACCCYERYEKALYNNVFAQDIPVFSEIHREMKEIV